MGLQLDGYDSDSGSEASGSQASSKAIGTIARRDSVDVPVSLSNQAKRKAPVKIGLNHPILRNLGADISPSTGSEDIGSVPSKRARPAQTPVGGRSGLLDLLPPPKKRLQTTQYSGIARGGISPQSSSFSYGQGETKVQESHEEVLEGDARTPSIVQSAGGKKNASAALDSDLFGLAPISQSAISTLPQTPISHKSGLRVWSAPETDGTSVHASNPLSSQTLRDSAVPIPEADLISAGAMGHAWKDVQSHEMSGLASWDVRKGLAAAKKIEAERARLTAPVTFNEPTNYKPAGRTNGLAGKRHQLSALLQDAQSNRRALEDRISENKRTKREAGSKYGF